MPWWLAAAAAAPYPAVVPLLDAAVLEQRERELREDMPAEVTLVQLHATGLVYALELQGPWVQRATLRRWQRLLERRPEVFGALPSPLALEKQTERWTQYSTQEPDLLRIHVEGDRATLYNRSPFPAEPPGPVLDPEELAARYTGQSYRVAWRCSEPVSVGCGPEPESEVYTLARSQLAVSEQVLGVCSGESALEVRRVFRLELGAQGGADMGWVAEARLDRSRHIIDALTGEDVSDRAWMGQYEYVGNPCR